MGFRSHVKKKPFSVQYFFKVEEAKDSNVGLIVAVIVAAVLSSLLTFLILKCFCVPKPIENSYVNMTPQSHP